MNGAQVGLQADVYLDAQLIVISPPKSEYKIIRREILSRNSLAICGNNLNLLTTNFDQYPPRPGLDHQVVDCANLVISRQVD